MLSYLIGSIPTSLLVSRLVKGIDLRQHGSKNLGATNLYRVLGWRYAVPVGLFDMAYGNNATPAVLGADERPVADGIDMLVAQAARSFEIWTGRPAPLEVMETAARDRST